MSDTVDTDIIEIEDWVLTGCACAACSATRGEVVDDAAFAEQTATAGGYQIDTDPTDPDQAIDALLGGISWNTTSLTFSFPDSSDDIGYNWSGEKSGFSAFNNAQASAARDALDIFASVSGLTFTELTGAADRDADLTFAESSFAGTAYAYFPSSGEWGGDSWFNTWHFNNPEIGTYGWSTFLHEIGHAVGLKHGHENYGAGALPSELDSHEYSLMTYRSYEGSSGAFYSNEKYGGPQSLMMLDIAAVQVLYGANYAHQDGDTVYAFDPETGQMLVDGVASATPGANRILRTIWDGDGEDTYDLSAYDSDLAIDLAPGGYVDLDVGGLAQRSRLGAGEYAKGHIFNALQWEGDDRSLIENAIAGAGDDTLLGNQTANRLDGGLGDDVLSGGSGDDVLIGGEGLDIAVFDGVFSDFVVTYAEDALEVLGEGLDLVFSSVEVLRFDDLDATFAELVPEPQVEEPSDPEEDIPADPTAAPEDNTELDENAQPEEPLNPEGDPADAETEAEGDPTPDAEDPPAPEDDELVDPPVDPPVDLDEPSDPVDEDPVDLTDEPSEDEPDEDDDLVPEPEEPSEPEGEGLSDPLDEPVEDEPSEPEIEDPSDPPVEPAEDEPDLETEQPSDPDEPSETEDDDLIDLPDQPVADEPVSVDPPDTETEDDVSSDELGDELDISDDEPSGGDPTETDLTEHDPLVDEPVEPRIDEPVPDEPVATEPEPKDPVDDETEDDSRRVPLTEEPIEDADEKDDLEQPDDIEPENDTQPDLTPVATDEDKTSEEPIVIPDDPVPPGSDEQPDGLVDTEVTPDEDNPEDEPPVPNGDDVFIFGETRADDLSGGKGDDTISGAGGEDTLRGGKGEDRLNGDAGDDLLLGGAENDVLSGGGGADILKGGSGDDRLMGGGAADTLNGGGGDDELSGGGGRDRLFGRGGDDRLDGGGGADTLRGNAGDDTLEGGAGRDVLAGGGGVDRFVFNDRFGRDRITDFDADRELLDFSQHSRVGTFDGLIVMQGVAGVVISDGFGGRIVLTGVERSEIDDSDFLF